MSKTYKEHDIDCHDLERLDDGIASRKRLQAMRAMQAGEKIKVTQKDEDGRKNTSTWTVVRTYDHVMMLERKIHGRIVRMCKSYTQLLCQS